MLLEAIASVVLGILAGTRHAADDAGLLVAGMTQLLAAVGSLTASMLRAGRGMPETRMSSILYRGICMACLATAGWARAPEPIDPGITLAAPHGSSPRTSRLDPQFDWMLDPVRAVFDNAASAHLGGNALSLYRGMVLGQRERFDHQLLEAMKVAGTTHLLAVSGLNVAVLVIAIEAAFRLGRCPPRMAALLAIPSVLIYALLVGGDPPVVRAAVMGVFVLTGKVIGRGIRAAQSLAASALFLLLLDPRYLGDVGFHLSYAAVGALIAAGNRFMSGDPSGPSVGSHGAGREAIHIVRRIAGAITGAFATTTVAQIGVFPLILALDGRASLVAPLANLAAVPPAGMVVPLGLLLPVAERLSPAAGCVLASVLWGLTRIVEVVSLWTASWQGSAITLGAPSPSLITAYYTGWLLFLAGGRKRVLGGAMVAGSAVAMCVRTFLPADGALPPPSARVTFLDVGQGDACVIESSRGSTLLVDSGPAGPRFDAGRSRVAPYLRRRGVRRIDLAILTHAHRDHGGGFPAVARAFEIATFVDGGEAEPSRSYLDLLLALQERGVRYRVPGRGDALFDDGVVRVSVIHSPTGPGRLPAHLPYDLNQSSVGVRIDVEGGMIVLLGDLGRARQDLLAPEMGFRPCRVFAAPHHGSRDAASSRLVEALRPERVVVSAGRRNAWHFPHGETLDMFQRAGIVPWVTGRDGDFVLIVSTGVVYTGTDSAR